jgi:ubiquinone/menaquinone biosynthesis C-methylase UbiE
VQVDVTVDTPRYLAALEAARPGWWDDRNFEKWRRHYVSEHERGLAIAQTLARHVPGFSVAGRRVLDVGCGDAGVAIALAESGASVAGIEPDRASLERGRIRAEEHGVAADLRHGFGEDLPFADASFDVVILDNVLEHVRDREGTLAEAARVLVPQGLLYMVTPKPFAVHSVISDPHYQIPGLVLLPPRTQKWYFERIHSRGRGEFSVGVIPTRRSALRMMRRAGFEPIASPRDLWIDYLRRRLARPEEVQPGMKRRVATYLRDRSWPFESRPMRLLWDVVLGANIFIARRS